WKKLYRLYREERLTMRKRGGRKRALGTRAPMAVPQGPNQRWSLDFVSDALVDGRRFRILCVLDDFSRECLATVVDNSLSGERVGRELDKIALRTGYPRMVVSDNGPSDIAAELAEWIDANGMSHVRGAPLHPQTQGKIERWHQTLKNRILLENYFLPGDLERQIAAFVDHYNHRRYHESIGNL